MSANRISSLLVRLADIQHRIERELARARPDWTAIMRMGRLRENIRSRLAGGFGLQAAPAPVSIRIPQSISTQAARRAVAARSMTR